MNVAFRSLEGRSRSPILTVDGEALSGPELGAAVAQYQAFLAGRRIEPGDRVAVWTEGDILTPIALLGNALYGAVTVPLNPSLGTAELAHVLGDAQPKVLLSARSDRGPDTVPIRLGSTAVLSNRMVPEDRDLLILYTSGTTGPPKGAVLSVGNVFSNVDALTTTWGLGEGDTIAHSLPLFHVHGLVLGLFGSMRAGAALHWNTRFDPDTTSAALGGPNRILFAVPTMYHRLLDAAEGDPNLRDRLGSARLLISGSAGLPLREHDRCLALTGRRIIERYGLTETLINTAVPPDAPTPGYVGPPLPGIDLELRDERGAPLDAHDDETIGEVFVRGPNVFRGYLHRPEATKAAMDDRGFFRTGDLATRNPSGAIRIVGRRATDLIKTGGFKVGAGEVEGALLACEGVAEAAVVGVEDTDLGERIVAFVVTRKSSPTLDAKKIAGHVAETLGPHKRPREIHFVDALPRNPMGKVQKHALHQTLKNDKI